MNAILTCVDFADILAVTLPRMVEVFANVLVVTSHRDEETYSLAYRTGGATPYRTDAFWQGGASFAKGHALEEGLCFLGKAGWIAILDADILLPADVDLSGVEEGNLYSPFRRICETQEEFGQDWSSYPRGPERLNQEFAGYFQLFHADDPVLEGGRPWYISDTWWKTAQGCDTDFYRRWPRGSLKRLPFEVLHLGPVCQNWSGRRSPQWKESQ